MRVTFDTNTLDPVTQPELAGAMRDECTAIHESLKSKRLQGFFCETVVTVEGGVGSHRSEVEEERVARVKRALDLGMRILNVPRNGCVRIDDSSGELYAMDADEGALAARLERFESIAAAIEARGLGYAHMLKVARFSPSDMKKVARAVAEWADGDSLAAHHGYANDLFCTEDRAVKAGRDSVMHPAQRGWLKRAYGVEFVSIAELAAAVR
ncbi:MAG: hypothetical protein JSR66_20610 [Proteobacteria bacterium]|nr:hypothetical protein [Pseudomonadota bacterium]